MISRRLRAFLCLLLLTFSLLIISPIAFSQDNAIEGNKIDGYPVLFDGEKLFVIQNPTGSFTSEERAEAISRRLETVAQDDSFGINTIKLEQTEESTNIITNDNVILTITETDAEAARKSQKELAEEYLKVIQERIARYREVRKPHARIVGVIYTIIATLSLLVILKILNFIFPRIHNFLSSYSERINTTSRVRNVNFLAFSYLIKSLASLIRFLRLLTILVVCYIYIPLVLSFFPLTKSIGKKLLNFVFAAIAIIWNAFVNYLPKLFIISFIILTTYYILRLIKIIFLELERGNISIPGFYRDWAKPTYNLLFILIIALAAVLIFPYLPGFNSPAFQGISVFLGLLLSLGSTSAIANTVGGIILTYTRAFQIGDQVKIGDIVGDVEEKTLLVTRIRTPKNVLVTIPNSTVLNSTVVNYSASARDTGVPLVLHTTVTLGYDIPWSKVYEALIAAANATEYILQMPSPFVLQTSLEDFYVSYELNAYTNETHKLPKIYSNLHQNIQDKCNAVGIEIMSPHYRALRDGNQTTIPAD